MARGERRQLALPSAEGWFAARGWQPFEFQRTVWDHVAAGRSGLLHATTGSGKTYAVWLGLRPSSMARQVVAAMSSAGLAAAFAHEARKLNEGAGKMASPTGGPVRLANFIERKAEHRPTVH